MLIANAQTFLNNSLIYSKQQGQQFIFENSLTTAAAAMIHCNLNFENLIRVLLYSNKLTCFVNKLN